MYEINATQIPGELSRENVVSSLGKIKCYVHMWKDHCCYGYIVNCAFRSIKQCIGKMACYFIGIYELIIHYMAAGRWEICLRVLKNISRVSAANEWNICQHLKANFAFPCGYAMSSIYSGLLVLNWCKAFSTGEIDRGAKCSYSNTVLCASFSW